MLPVASRAVTVSTFWPDCSTMPLAVQLAVPVAVPLPPRSLLQVTCVTPTLSLAVPPSVSGLAPVACVAAAVGVAIAICGAAASGGGGDPATEAAMSVWISAALSARL